DRRAQSLASLARGAPKGSGNQPHFAFGAGPELDYDGALADERRDLAEMVLHEPHLGPRRIVLGERADPVEDFRAAFVVEVFRRQPFLARGEAAQDLVPVVGEARLDRTACRDVDGAGHAISLMRPSPGGNPGTASDRADRKSCDKSAEYDRAT